MSKPLATTAESSGVALDKKTLKGLMRRSDRPGLRYLGFWALFLAAGGGGLALSLGTWLAVPATVLRPGDPLGILAERRTAGRGRGQTLLGETVAYAPVPWVWSDQYDWNLQVAGFPAEGDGIALRGSVEDGKALFFALKDGALIGAAGLGRGTAAAKDLRLAQMMIERGLRPDAAQLADPDVSLKQLMKAA